MTTPTRITKAAEEWRKIPNSEAIVSNMGEVIVGKYRGFGSINSSGYFQKLVCIDGIKRKWKVHRLIMLAFHGPSELHVNHINGIKTDNKLENLEYVTPKQNAQHAFRIGLNSGKKGQENYNSKLTEKAVLEIAAKKLSKELLAKKHNVTVHTIKNIQCGQIWGHVTGIPKKVGKSRSVYHEYNGLKLKQFEWCQRLGISNNCFVWRLRNWTDRDKIFSLPKGAK